MRRGLEHDSRIQCLHDLGKNVDDIDRNREGRMMNASGRQGEKEGDIGCQ